MSDTKPKEEDKSDLKTSVKSIAKQYWNLKRIPEDPNHRKVTYRTMGFVFLYTSLFFSIPVVIMTNRRLFNRFCRFHSRLLNLKIRSSAGIFGFAFLMSTIYTSCAIPLWYKGLKRILGFNDISDLRISVYDSISNRYMLKEDSSDSRSNQQILEDIDREIVQYIDEAAGIPKGKIKKFMRMKRKEYQDSA